MIPLFTRPLHRLTYPDVEDLWKQGVTEGQTVEFKVRPSGKDGTRHDWFKGASSIGSIARDDILQVVVAFANSDGGNIVLGIAESQDGQKRALRAVPIPRCKLLANHLRQLANAQIEVPVPQIEFCGIPKKANDDQGVVLIRIPPSRFAPHRLKSTKECYTRRGDDSPPMTIREIQDRTLRSASAFAALEGRLKARRETIAGLLSRLEFARREFWAVRVTLIPTASPIFIRQVYRNALLFPALREFDARASGKDFGIGLPHQGREIELHAARPILRGARRETSRQNGTVLQQEVHSDGLVELFFQIRPTGGENYVYVEWVLAFVANGLLIADAMRQIAGTPMAELVLDVEIGSAPSPFKLAWPDIIHGISRMGDASGPIEHNPLRLPPYTVTETEEFGEIVRNVMNDLREAGHHHAIDDFEIDFSEA